MGTVEGNILFMKPGDTVGFDEGFNVGCIVLDETSRSTVLAGLKAASSDP